MIFGAVIDASCLIWEEGCYGTGFCHFYDIDKVRYGLFGITTGLVFLSAILAGVAWIQIKRLNLPDDEEVKSADDSNNQEFDWIRDVDKLVHM